MSSEPQTRTGRALADWLGNGDRIVAIEAEAVAAYRADLEAKVRALDYRMVEWWNPDGKRYSLRQVVTWTAVLRLLTDGAEPPEAAS